MTSIGIGSQATFDIDGAAHAATLQLGGIYNLLNAAAALCLVKEICDHNDQAVTDEQLVSALADIKPAFGRGETIVLDNVPVELILVKNPSGFRLALMSHTDNPGTMIAINDNYADGRDVSWLWDVEFDRLKSSGVDVVTGSRAHDMALRLKYDEVPTRQIDTDLLRGLENFIKSEADRPKKIYCTYTAMTAIRRELAKVAKVERVR